MAQFRLTSLAEADLDGIWDYVSGYSEQAADSLIDELFERFIMLARFQEAGRDRTELAPNLRSFPVGSYVIFYRAREEGIEIVRVLHGSMDIPRKFAEEGISEEE